MPVRINLKEVFPADSQEITVDKVNFNFNKLLELGIGEQGIQGFAGIQGAAGPIGIQGLEGVRGATWYLDTVADPNTLTIPDLLDGDLYLNTVTFSVWQYDGAQWTFVFDLTSIINNYLASSPLPFVRGFGLGSPNDDRFIVFARRGETTSDISDDISLGALGNPANNDTLFLTNFNEDKLNDPAIWSGFPNAPSNNGPTPTPGTGDTEYFFNSLLSIYLDHQLPLSEINGRSHIELGSLYNDPSNGLTLTTVFENFKLRFFRIENGVNSYNTAQFTMDPPGSSPSVYRNLNSVFEFCAPKKGTSINGNVSVYLGSKYGLDHIVGNNGTINVDGSLYVQGASSASTGLAMQFRIGTSNTNYSFPTYTGYVSDTAANSYLMLDVGGLTDGIYLNDTTLQNRGNIIQLGMSEPSQKPNAITSNSSPATFKGHAGIVHRGNEVYVVSGDPDVSNLITNYGYFERYSIENPNHPIAQWSNFYGRFRGYTEKTGSAPACTLTSYYGKAEPVGTGASDVAVAGDYMYTVHTQNLDDTSSQNAVLPYYEGTYFQILKINSKNVNSFGLERVSRLGLNATTGSQSVGTNPDELTSAYRIKLNGNYALVATNCLHAPSSSFSGLLNYTGGITAIDVTDPTDPVIVASVSSNLTDGASATVYNSASILDMTVVGDTLYTLTLQLTSATQKVRVFVEAYDLRQLNGSAPTITWIGESTNILATTGGSYSSILKRGAIAANDKYIYVAYGDAIKIISLNTATPKTNTPPYCKNQYVVRQTLQLTYPAGVLSSTKQSLDIKQYGNSVYVLAEGYTSAPPSAGDITTYIFKADVSIQSATNTSVPALTQIYRTPLPTSDTSSYFYSRFEIIGKHIYTVTHDQADNTGLVTLDIDGIYTGTAHIESLRSESVKIGQDLSVGGNTTLNSSLSVGGNTLVGENLGVSGLITGMGAVPVGAVTPWAGATGGNIITGSNIVTNGNFTANASDGTGLVVNNWLVFGGATIKDYGSTSGWNYSSATGYVQHGGALTTPIYQSGLGLQSGTFYKITFSLSSITLGAVRVGLGLGSGSTISQYFSSNGTKSVILYFTDTDDEIFFEPDNNSFNGRIDDVTVEPISAGLALGPEITQNGGFTGSAANWLTSLGNSLPNDGWLHSANSVSCTATNRELIQTGSGISSYTTYQVTLDILSCTSGQVQISLGGSGGISGSAYGPSFYSAGVYTFYIQVNSFNSDTISIEANAFSTYTINSISVKEVRRTWTVPKGWLLCDGNSYSQTEYSALYDTLGQTYGAIGSNFRVPNLRSRVPVGSNFDQPATDQIGFLGGEIEHTLIKAELPPHQHVIGNGPDSSSLTSGNHTHLYVNWPNQANIGNGGSTATNNGVATTQITNGTGAHTHTGNTGDGTSDGLFGAAHNIMQPYIVMNYIIFAGN